MTVVVVGLALLATVMLLRQVLLRDLDARIDQALAQEAEEFAESVGSAAPGSEESATAFARRVLEDYLATNVPVDDEVLIAVVGGNVFAQSRGAQADITGQLGPLTASVEPATAVLDSSAGEVRLLTQPMLMGDEPVGALVVGIFVDPERETVERAVRNAALVATASLVAAIALAWFVAGRVLRPIRLVADTARDITEHDISRRIPEQGSAEIASLIDSFNAMLDRLQAGVEAQRRFLDDAGHELRTPLTILRGHLELAAADPSQYGDTAPVVLAEVDRMTRIADDLLTMARAEQGDFLRLAPIDLDDFVSGLLPLVVPLGPQQWSVDPAPVGVVRADRDRLTQAILNLAVNAARHTPPDGHISISCRLGGGHVSFSVTDTGEGIPADDQAQIFERFHRVSAPGASRGVAGLGLAIVTTIAEAHGGHAGVESRPGHGATFTITIPTDTDSTDPEEAPWHAS